MYVEIISIHMLQQSTLPNTLKPLNFQCAKYIVQIQGLLRGEL